MRKLILLTLVILPLLFSFSYAQNTYGCGVIDGLYFSSESDILALGDFYGADSISDYQTSFTSYPGGEYYYFETYDGSFYETEGHEIFCDATAYTTAEIMYKTQEDGNTKYAWQCLDYSSYDYIDCEAFVGSPDNVGGGSSDPVDEPDGSSGDGVCPTGVGYQDYVYTDYDDWINNGYSDYCLMGSAYMQVEDETGFSWECFDDDPSTNLYANSYGGCGIKWVGSQSTRTVFVSTQEVDASISYNGNTGRLNADTICQEESVSRGLTGTYKAFLADGLTLPGPYTYTSQYGQNIFSTTASGEISQIHSNLAGGDVWTGLYWSSEAYEFEFDLYSTGGYSCGSWTGSDQTIGAYVWDTTSWANSNWEAVTEECYEQNKLLCVQTSENAPDTDPNTPVNDPGCGGADGRTFTTQQAMNSAGLCNADATLHSGSLQTTGGEYYTWTCEGWVGDSEGYNHQEECSAIVSPYEYNMFITDSSHTGRVGFFNDTVNYVGLEAADAICNADARTLGLGGQYKALLGTSERNPDGSDWIFKNDKRYVDVRGTASLITDNSGYFYGSLRNFVNPVDTSSFGDSVWLGLSEDQGADPFQFWYGPVSQDVSKHCSDWTVQEFYEESGTESGGLIYPDYGGSYSLSYGNNYQDECWNAYPFFCVEAEKGPDLVLGCTDPEASNYDEYAVIDDGSCVADSSQLRIFRADRQYTGLLNGTAGADAICQQDLNNPDSSKQWKALLGTSERSPGNSDWVLEPNTDYLNNGAVLDRTDSEGKFTPPIDAEPYDYSAFGTGSPVLWTGLTSTMDLGNNCNNWFSVNSESNTGLVLEENNVDFIAGSRNCETSAGLICVEQPEAYVAQCGNYVVDEGEACDDGNTVDGDGCSSTCQVNEVLGCTDSDAENHNIQATVDDGSCRYTPNSVCGSAAGKYTLSIPADDLCDLGTSSTVTENENSFDWTCTANEVAYACQSYLSTSNLGCTDPAALNYNIEAESDDGSCQYYSCGSVNGTVQDSLSPTSIGLCQGSGIFVETFESSTTGWSWNCTQRDDSQNYVSSLSCEAYNLIEGCTNPAADNYDSSANVDDGSCTYVSACGSNPQTILRLSGITNAFGQVANQSSYGVAITYEDIFGVAYEQASGACLCDGSNSIINLSSQSSGLFGTDYDTNVCFGDLRCEVRPTQDGCMVGEAAVLRLTGTSNAFAELGSYSGSYPYTVCCSSQSAAVERRTVEGISMCGVTYYCGDADGVCPQNFNTTLGRPAQCASAPDPDCSGFISDFSVSFIKADGEVLESAPSNSHTDEIQYSEFENATTYAVTVRLDSVVDVAESVTTLQLRAGYELREVIFDMKQIGECDIVQELPCYEASASAINIRHSLSPHILQVLFEKKNRDSFLTTISTILLVFVFSYLLVHFVHKHNPPGSGVRKKSRK